MFATLRDNRWFTECNACSILLEFDHTKGVNDNTGAKMCMLI